MKKQNEFGVAFKTIRIARGLTQEDFAQHSGRTYVSELERGVKHPTLQKIDELAVPLNVHPLTLIALSYLNQCSLSSYEELLQEVSNELGEVVRLARSSQ